MHDACSLRRFLREITDGSFVQNAIGGTQTLGPTKRRIHQKGAFSNFLPLKFQLVGGSLLHALHSSKRESNTDALSQHQQE